MQRVNLRAQYHHEWLLTNGLGGYGLGFGDLLSERKYNCLLTAGLDNFARIQVLNSIEERVEWQSASFYLDAAHYPNCIHPQGYTHIIKSWLRPHPAFLYSADPITERFLILKEVFLLQGRNGLVVRYTNLGTGPINMILRPKFSLRDHHHLNPPGAWDGEDEERSVEDGSFSLRRPGLDLTVTGFLEHGDVVDNRIVYRNVYYPLEASRGYEAVEDLLAPVGLRFTLDPGLSNRFLVELDPAENPWTEASRAEEYYHKQPLPRDHPQLLRYEENWLERLLHNQEVYSEADYYRILENTARDFLTTDDIIAGYPWFGPWGRDSLIALEGLSELSGGKRLAVRILKKYGREIRSGLIPNVFGEGGAGLNYDTIDAPLWYLLRCYQFAPKDKELFGRCRRIVAELIHDPDPRVGMADDGLLEIRPGEHALTWMDAKVYDRPVTPRWGKPVEINALWYNGLRSLIGMAEARGIEAGGPVGFGQYKMTLARLKELAEKVKDSLQAFVTEDFLADRLTGQGPVPEVRPNAVIAAALEFDWLAPEVLARVLATAEAELLTPKGLRSLSPHDPAFKKKYLGTQKQRDLAYHQGTVWAWPLWDLAKLNLKVHAAEDPADRVRRLRGLSARFRTALKRNHIASVAEVWDGDEPNLPKGCPAQAWSVMAVFLIEAAARKLESGR